MNASSFSCPCSSQAARAAIHPYRNITPHAPVAYGARTGSLSRSPSVRTCTRCWASRPARSPRFFALLLFLFLFRERPFPLPPQQRRPQHDVTCMTSLVPAGTARGRKNLFKKTGFCQIADLSWTQKSVFGRQSSNLPPAADASSHFHAQGGGSHTSGADIKRAYKRRALQWHPDRHTGGARQPLALWIAVAH